MEVSLVRFSRPLLIITDYDADGPIFNTAYGFLVRANLEGRGSDVENYVAYLCGLSWDANGGSCFPLPDDWKARAGRKDIKRNRDCKRRLNLRYYTVFIDLDEDLLRDFVDSYNLINSEDDFNYLLRHPM